MFVVVSFMLSGVLVGFLLRKKSLKWIQKVITLFIWLLLFLLGVDSGTNEEVISSFPRIGLEALIITFAAIVGSVLCAWFLWYRLNKRKED